MTTVSFISKQAPITPWHHGLSERREPFYGLRDSLLPREEINSMVFFYSFERVWEIQWISFVGLLYDDGSRVLVSIQTKCLRQSRCYDLMLISHFRNTNNKSSCWNLNFFCSNLSMEQSIFFTKLWRKALTIARSPRDLNILDTISWKCFLK